MEMKATMLAQPVDDVGVFVGPVVVKHEVKLLLRIGAGFKDHFDLGFRVLG